MTSQKNYLQVFQNEEFGNVRVVEIDGEPWFVGRDIADNLGYTNPSKALIDHVEIEDKLNNETLSSLGQRGGWIINESGLYSLILSSKLLSAKKFKRWVTSEILPSIRKHGAYVTDDLLKAMAENTELAQEVMKNILAERNRNESLKNKNIALMDYISEIAPKAYYHDIILQSDTPIATSVIAKDYDMTAIAFNQLLKDLGIQYKIGNTWLLKKDYTNKGYTITKTYHITDKKTAVSTYWLQNGRFFLYDILKWGGILPIAEKNSCR